MKDARVVAPCQLMLLLTLAASSRAEDAKSGYANPPMPRYRVQTEGFDASQADIRAVCGSAGRELWRFFSDYEIEPFVVQRGHNGPIVLFARNDRREIVMRLDTHGAYWCQYAYQFAHEFCHILCGYDEDYAGSKWFEETLCETASLFAIRAMARSWEKDPPYSNWKEYRHALRKYADDVLAKRTHVLDIYRTGLNGFYLEHQELLEGNAGLRELNGAMSLVFLRLFEEKPERWEAVRWLNHAPSPPGETFQQYLQKWHDAVPGRHKPFVTQVAELYGVEITGTNESEAPLVSATNTDRATGAGTEVSTPSLYNDPPMPKYRVDPKGFEASEPDIKAVCDSTGRELWRYFSDREIEPFVVMRGNSGPVVLYERNRQGEIVVKLDTHSTHWSQYAYQFSYLFGNILCGFDADSVGNKWFEATVCEAASLFALRAMAKAWESDPPYPHWKDYRHSLSKYAQDAIEQRKKLTATDVKEYYRKHRKELAGSASPRSVTGAMAVVLLEILEEKPEHWEAVRWLNRVPSPKDESFGTYLQRWHNAVPPKHKLFVKRIADLYGIEFTTKEPARS